MASQMDDKGSHAQREAKAARPTTRRNVEELAVDLLGRSLDTVSSVERKVLELVHLRQLASRSLVEVVRSKSGFGDKLADRVAAVGGSWGFIIGFGFVLGSWMALNSGALAQLGVRFDPYPFIFLNLVLSTLAAVQAPIIMMSQNRAATKDRMAAQIDYEVNLRNELEIMRLHEKLDKIVARLDEQQGGENRFG